MTCLVCLAVWTCEMDPDEPLLKICPECSSRWAEMADTRLDWSPGDGCVDAPDALAPVVGLIRAVFGPGVEEIRAA